MFFGLFKKKDPICGMKEEKGKGLHKDGHWFCDSGCMQKYAEQMKNLPKKSKEHSCCHP